MFNLDEFDRIIEIGNRHKKTAAVKEQLLDLTQDDRQFIKGTLFGIGIGIGLMLLMAVVMACL